MHLYQHINVVDARAPWQTFFNAWLETDRGPTRNIEVNEQWSMDRICRRILQSSEQLAASSRHTGLGVLRLVCHGNAGIVQLGSGFSEATIGSFRLLRGHFAGRYPRIEVLACGVLSSTEVSRERPEGTVDLNSAGHALMWTLADAAQVLVIAAYNLQLHYPNGSMAYEGPVRHFRPRTSP